MSQCIVLPDPLLRWLDREMPALRGASRVQILAVKRFPFEWLWAGGHAYSGLTLWGTIYLRESFYPLDLSDTTVVELLFHELVHVEQFTKNPVRLPVRYLYELTRKGYWENSKEIEARERAAAMVEKYQRERPV